MNNYLTKIHESDIGYDKDNDMFKVTFPTTTMKFHNSAASTNATNAKNSEGKIFSIIASNVNASVRYLKLYNKATAPTVGTDVPVITIALASNSTVSVPCGTYGIRFTTGISYAITGAAADNDTTAIGANDVKLILAYI